MDALWRFRLRLLLLRINISEMAPANPQKAAGEKGKLPDAAKGQQGQKGDTEQAAEDHVEAGALLSRRARWQRTGDEGREHGGDDFKIQAALPSDSAQAGRPRQAAG